MALSALILLTILASALISFIVYELIKTIKGNLEARNYLKSKSPNLPFLPNLNLISGHAHLTHFNFKSWQFLDEAHKIYGPTYGHVFWGIPAVSSLDLDLIKTVALEEANEHLNRNPLNVPTREIRNSIAFARDDQWRRLRRAIAPAFTHHKIMSTNVQADIRMVTDRFIKSMELKFENEQSIVMDVDDLFNRFSLDLVFKCFYKQDGLINYHTHEDYYVKLTDQAVSGAKSVFNYLCLAFPDLISPVEYIASNLHPVGVLTNIVVNFIKDQTRRHLQAKKQTETARKLAKEGTFDGNNFELSDGTRFRRNLIDFVIENFQSGILNEREFIDSTYFLFMATTKTTADALSKLVYHLAANRDVQDKLRKSTLVDGTESEYLSWCINESLRLFPPVSATIRTIKRDIHAKVGLIPAGTLVLASAFSFHRSKDIWGPEADKFNPDRWIDSKSFHPAQNISFGLGVRNCIGKDLALDVMKKLMVEMVVRYEFILTPTTTPESIMDFGSVGFIALVANVPTNIRIKPLNRLQNDKMQEQ